MKAKIREWSQSKLSIELYKIKPDGEQTFDVFLLEGAWPPDWAVVNLCEGGGANGGGEVKPSDQGKENHRVVVVQCNAKK